MDEPLITAPPATVCRWIARQYLDGPGVSPQLGSIQLQRHQLDAAVRVISMIEETGGAVLADATGMGKTFVAIAVARAIGPALVAAPAALRGMWHDALRRASTVADFVSFEALSRGMFQGPRPSLLVVDEAHHARNPRARRYAALAGLAWGTRVLLLTATPVHNRGRDLRALLALYLGSRAWEMTMDEVARSVVRRRPADNTASASLPALEAPEWLAVPSDRETFGALLAVPEAVPGADGKAAHALMVLGLLRAWSSSAAALRAMLRRRLQRAVSLSVALEAGRIPDRRELAATLVIGDAVQLGFAELMGGVDRVDSGRLCDALARHCEGIRAVLRAMDQAGDADGCRTRLLGAACDRHPTPVVAFTQFADTATAIFRTTVTRGGVALVTGKGARIAAGRVSIDEVVRGFDIDLGGQRDATPRPSMPFNLLVTTDVLSEGLSLRRAGVIVHLDLPWTVARLEQRLGRVRRQGSPHRRIAVYAIGPPVGSRELASVVRALQRKARLSSAAGMGDSTAAATPLVGNRLTRATASITSRGEAHAEEVIRSILSRWVNETPGPGDGIGAPEDAALALVVAGSRRRLLAVRHGVASAALADVQHVLRTLGGDEGVGTPRSSSADARVVTAIATWIEHERAHALVAPAVGSPSAAQATILRELQALAAAAGRAERAAVEERVEHCRALVLSARGIGAEMAMDGFLAAARTHGAFDLTALESLLTSRRSGVASDESWRLLALVTRDAGSRSALVVRDADLARQSVAEAVWR